MSVSSFLNFKSTLCSTCHRFPRHRFYTSQALAFSPALVTHPLGYHSRRNQDTAKTSSQSATPRRNPLEPNKVDIYLASLRATGREPTIDDVDRCRPRQHSHPSSPQYAEDYNMLVDRLCRSFSKEQLRKFVVQCGLTSTRSVRKVQLAEAIIEKQWNWPSLKDIERHKRDMTEVSTKSFPLNPDQLFLILGKDGADLLQMSMEYNVHMALTSNLTLRVEGVRGSLKELTERISELKQGIMEETFELPTKSPIRQDLVQRISRLAGAFIDNVGTEGMVRICAKDPRNLVTAKRLATRAVCEVQESPTALLLSHIPLGLPSSTPVPTALFPHTYSLFPFLSPRSFPWTMNAGGAFRIRRVGEWLGTNCHENVQSTGGLAEGKGQILTMAGKPCDLKRALLGDIPETAVNTTKPSRTVTASLGHILFTSSSPGQRTSIVPPLKGFWVFPKILKWLQNSHTKAAFVPSLPALLLSSPPTEQRILHRLIYRVLPTSMDTQLPSTNVIKYEIVLAQPKSLNQTPVQDSGTAPEIREENLEYAESMSASNNSVEGQAAETSEDPSSRSNLVLPSRCWSGTQNTVNLMMPDRPMDVHFSVFNAMLFTTSQEPMELQNYLTDLRSFLEYKDADTAQPEPPMSFTHEGLIYVLHTSASVRQNNESVSVHPTGRHSGPDPTSPLIRVVSESILDLESNHKSTVCQATWHVHGSEESWKDFLRDCDHLSSTIYRPVGDQETSFNGATDII